MGNNGIKHFRSAPYYPSTNGAIQRLVQTFAAQVSSTYGFVDGKDDGGVSSTYSITRLAIVTDMETTLAKKDNMFLIFYFSNTVYF